MLFYFLIDLFAFLPDLQRVSEMKEDPILSYLCLLLLHRLLTRLAVYCLCGFTTPIFPVTVLHFHTGPSKAEDLFPTCGILR